MVHTVAPSQVVACTSWVQPVDQTRMLLRYERGNSLVSVRPAIKNMISLRASGFKRSNLITSRSFWGHHGSAFALKIYSRAGRHLWQLGGSRVASFGRGCGHYSIKGNWVHCDAKGVERRRAAAAALEREPSGHAVGLFLLINIWCNINWGTNLGVHVVFAFFFKKKPCCSQINL